MSDDYRPIDCGIHDRLQLFAMRRTSCRILYRDDDGGEHCVRDELADVYTRGREEYARLSCGKEIRLDRLLRVEPD